MWHKFLNKTELDAENRVPVAKGKGEVGLDGLGFWD